VLGLLAAVVDSRPEARPLGQTVVAVGRPEPASVAAVEPRLRLLSPLPGSWSIPGLEVLLTTNCTACFAIRCNVIKSAACCSPSSHSCKWPGKGRKVSVAAEIVDVEKPGDTVEP
jgi:hypothetical protein